MYFMLLLLCQMRVFHASWWSSFPLRRKEFMLPEDSIPKEEGAKFMFQPFQHAYFAVYRKKSFLAGIGFFAGCRWVVEKGDTLMRCMQFPKVDTLVVYARSKEKYCKLGMNLWINVEGKEYVSWYNTYFKVRPNNEWTRGVMVLKDVLVPNPWFQSVEGVRFAIFPAGGSTDSCPSFDVGPIYLK